jgi:UDP-N-acetylmuramate dehydrogenase
MPTLTNIQLLRDRFGEHLQENVVLANYTTVRAGGTADAFLPVNSSSELESTVKILWDLDVAFMILGSGSNVLVSDKGVRGVVLLNRTRNIKIDGRHNPPTVWAESGANLGHLTRQLVYRGFSGMEWAANIPGTLGGAVCGNAGAYGADMASSLVLVEILHRHHGRETWPVESMGYTYRSSILKQEHIPAVIMAARMKLIPSTSAEVQARMEQNNTHRRRTQPPGASMGSMFKNPPDDYAGRLIDAAGLKGKRIGNVEISAIHANFFINLGRASANDVYQLIRLAQKTVEDKFGVSLELEIELVGDWEGSN